VAVGNRRIGPPADPPAPPLNEVNMRHPLPFVLALLLALLPRAAEARQQEADAQAPPEVVELVLEVANAPTTSRFDGPTRIGAGRTITGEVVVLDGPLSVDGRIEGDVVVVNGDLTVAEEGRITGTVLVVGGRVRAAPGGTVGGDVVQYPGRLRLVRTADGVRQAPGVSAGRRGLYVGGARITVRAGTNYNRVEGLPVLFGPIFQTGSRNPLRFEALGIWRTEHEKTRDDVGYIFRADQTFGPTEARLGLGVSAFSRVTPVESWGLSDLESSLAAFLFHVDYRDYFEERGWSVYGRAAIPGTGAQVRLEYTDHEIRTLQVSSPWSVLRNDEPWRPLPLVASGDLRTLSAELTWDERNDPERPSDGWFLRSRLTFGLGGDLLLPGPGEPVAGGEDAVGDVEIGAPVPVSTAFNSGFLDVRRYARLSPDHDLALRVVAGGSLNGDPLPPRLQHTLGGEGSLPGHRLMSRDCGARATEIAVERRDGGGRTTVFPRYGCSRIALFQAEYRGRLPLGFGDDGGWEEEGWAADGWIPDVDFSPGWALFFNAGRGWSQLEGAPDSDTAADVGVGLLLGKLGLYWAYPLTGDDRRVNFFVRLQRRF
jgi:hypothetical protein